MSRGAAFLLKAKFGDDQFRTIAGLKLTREEISGEPVMRKAVGDKYALLLDGMTGSHIATGSGIFVSGDAERTLRRAALEGAILPFELSFEDGLRLRANYLTTKMEYIGDFNGERNYEIAVMSSGKVEVL